jgi:hypothetical protein
LRTDEFAPQPRSGAALPGHMLLQIESRSNMRRFTVEGRSPHIGFSGNLLAEITNENKVESAHKPRGGLGW